MKNAILILVAVGAFFLIDQSTIKTTRAYNPPEQTVGPLHVTIEGPSVVKQADQPVTCHVLLENLGTHLLNGTVRIGLIDGWHVQGNAETPFVLQPSAATRLTYRIVAGKGTYSGHYPIHGFITFSEQGNKQTAHPILIVKTEFPKQPRSQPRVTYDPMVLRPNSQLNLWQAPKHRLIVRVFGEPPVLLPVGYWGSEPRSHAQVTSRPWTLGGDQRQTLSAHPPWADGHVGTVVVEYPVKLPERQPITLAFANAMDPKGKGDGVTFRVRVAQPQIRAGELGTIVFERHVTATDWQNAQVDLSEFAGQSIRLQLESHPGPKNNTGWDLSIWGEPTLRAGTVPKPPMFPPEDMDESEMLGTTQCGNAAFDVFFWNGRRGLLDATLGFRNKQRTIYSHGFEIRILGIRIDQPGSPVSLVKTERKRTASGVCVRHFFDSPEGSFELVGWIEIEHDVLKVRFQLENRPQPRPWTDVHIEDISIGRWSQPVAQIYAGHGNVLRRPGPFRLSCDGHRLATSFVGYDFPSGISLVEAIDSPPLWLDVLPDRQHASIHASGAQSRTIIPATNVWQAVRKWRTTNGLKPASGVQPVAGRFVFDLWGGKYGDSASQLRQAMQYGLTDSMVIWHNWQRWGYDYRLPEIYPPNPTMGTESQLQDMISACRKAGVLFALHDNYIDYYPDAKGFSYETKIAFRQDGTPVRAWLNKGRDAQSYRYRADAVQPLLRNNLHLIRQHLGPTAYFIDVWSSIRPYDYWTSDGRFTAASSTRDIWRSQFAWIREYLGNDAPQISESGTDQLIGWLDGAQTNHLRVGKPTRGSYGWAVWNWDCDDAERIPWFDAAHHDRFILHGAGYEPRYAAGLDTRLHGIYSDDYITTEVLTGHPAMVSRPFGRDVIRVYWLTHDLMRALAKRTIESVEFAGNNLHHQRVGWSGGGKVWVNRGAKDWPAERTVLPQYGFLTRIPTDRGIVEAAIERRDGLIVEWSRSPDQLYVNARHLVDRPLPVRLAVQQLRYLGHRTFQMQLKWTTRVPIPTGWSPFLHFCDAAGEIAFQASHTPAPLAVDPDGTISAQATGSIPDSLHPGQIFELCYGFYNKKSGARLPLVGPNTGDRRIRLGHLKLEGQKQHLTGVTWVPSSPKTDPFLTRQNPEDRVIDFGGIATSGSCRLTRAENRLTITPLPRKGVSEFGVTIQWDQLPWKLPEPNGAVALDPEGKRLPTPVDFKKEGHSVRIICKPDVFAYRLTTDRPPTR